MGPEKLYCAGRNDASRAAAEILKARGFCIADAPGPTITDVLLDIPSFDSAGLLAGNQDPVQLWEVLSPGTRVWGGKLKDIPPELVPIDLLQDPGYLAENAAITADCAIKLAGPKLKAVWKGSSVLVIGWGRIGKHLCRMLKALGAQITVCARKESDRALASAFGYKVRTPDQLNGDDYQVIFNTAPAPMMEQADLRGCPLPIDLASSPGLRGIHVIWARGLPRIYAPISSGHLIADTLTTQLRGDI